MELSKQANKMAEDGSYDAKVYQAYINIVGAEYAEVEHADEEYQGEYSDDASFTQELLESCGNIPADLPSYVYIDWEKTARAIMMDYSDDDGHYFRNF